VSVLDGQRVAANDVAGVYAAPLAHFFVAGNTADRGGVRVATKLADADRRADVVVGSGESSAATVRVYLGRDFTGTGEPHSVQEIDVFGGAVLPGGVYDG
jgi:hypothetical protein